MDHRMATAHPIQGLGQHTANESVLAKHEQRLTIPAILRPLGSGRLELTELVNVGVAAIAEPGVELGGIF